MRWPSQPYNGNPILVRRSISMELQKQCKNLPLWLIMTVCVFWCQTRQGVVSPHRAFMREIRMWSRPYKQWDQFMWNMINHFVKTFHNIFSIYNSYLTRILPCSIFYVCRLLPQHTQLVNHNRQPVTLKLAETFISDSVWSILSNWYSTESNSQSHQT